VPAKGSGALLLKNSRRLNPISAALSATRAVWPTMALNIAGSASSACDPGQRYVPFIKTAFQPRWMAQA